MIEKKELQVPQERWQKRCSTEGMFWIVRQGGLRLNAAVDQTGE